MARQFRFLLLLLVVSGLSATRVFWTYEHGVNPHITTYGDTLWWWFVSSTTVGYGDIAPVTTMGRLAGVVTIIIGIYCYTNFITLTADSLHGLTNQKRLGTAQVKARDHIIICEYTAFADELIQVLPHYSELACRECVIVTDLVQVQPYPQHHFVRGVPLSPAALKQASIAEAAYIFVFANIRFIDPDFKTLHAVSRISQLNPTAKIFVELTNPELDLAQGLDPRITVLPSREMLAAVMKERKIDLTRHFAKA